MWLAYWWRATPREARKLAIRTALGGGRLRLLGERMMESFLLSTAGGALGLLLAWGALRWLVSFRQDMNRVEAIHIDGVVTICTLAAVVVCALLSGLISAASGSGRQL